MKISPSNVGRFPQLDNAASASRAEGAKAFSLKPKAEAAVSQPRAETAAARPELRAAAADSPMAASLRSVAADFKAGRIPNREDAVKKMVSTVLREQYGQKVTNDRGFQKMEQSIASLISDDPALSRRMESLLQRLG
jgi:hypothetical protein